MKSKVKISPKPPMLPGPEISPNANQIKLLDETEYASFVLTNYDLSDQEARYVIFECALLTQVRLNNCRLPKLKMRDIRFDKCDLSNVEWFECKIDRMEIFDSKLTGFKAVDADLANSTFQNCVGELVQMQGSKFKSTVFQNCKLKGIDFRYSNLEGATFIDCDLREAEFYDAKLKGADFRGSDLIGIKARPEDLKGAIINSQQAFDLGKHFALLLGIEIKEDGKVSL
jgi:uncharacterized protein YjbI with pentapeptide repeats